LLCEEDVRTTIEQITLVVWEVVLSSLADEDQQHALNDLSQEVGGQKIDDIMLRL
jgi:hypothetical protein